jgi:hypothetical protein
LCAVSRMVPSRSSSSGAPVRANLRSRRSASLILLVPHLRGAEIAVLVLADAHAFGMIAVGAERRGACRPDPLAAALMPALLLCEPLAQGLEQLVETAQRLDLLLLLLGQILLGELFQPFRRDFRRRGLAHQFEALEHVAEHAIELVEIALILHQRGAREIVEVVDATRREVGVHRFHQRQIFAQRHRDAGGLELMQERDEHDRRITPCAPEWEGDCTVARAGSGRFRAERTATGRKPVQPTSKPAAACDWERPPACAHARGARRCPSPAPGYAAAPASVARASQSMECPARNCCSAPG